MERCSWCNLDNDIYVLYHDKEWGVENFSDEYLFEMLILESFQAGLSWECVLNKREAFRKAYDNFSLDKVCKYDESKVDELLNNKKIIRNKLKIRASINNARIFKSIVLEMGSFYSSELSDRISNDLKKRGMKFVGTTIIYSYLQAIGVIYSHEEKCFMYRGGYV